MVDTLSVAVAQCPANLGDPHARLCWLKEKLERHEGAPLDLIILPELFQSGYNIGNLMTARAESSDGAFAASIARLARARGTAILYGFAERKDGEVFNSAQCIDRNGKVIGIHRKLLLPPIEGNCFARGTGCELFRLNGFTLAILICYDVEFPEILRHIALAGAEIIAVPTALNSQWGVVSKCVVPARAFENGVFLCYANYCARENGIHYLGGSCIIAPDGNELARAGKRQEILTAKLEKPAIRDARKRLPYLKDCLRLPWTE